MFVQDDGNENKTWKFIKKHMHIIVIGIKIKRCKWKENGIRERHRNILLYKSN